MSAVLRASQSPPYRMHHCWQPAVQQCVQLSCLAEWCATRRLLSKAECEERLGLGAVTCDVDDFLLGVAGVTKELVRLAVNAVRAGNPALVHPISAFLHDLYAGLRLLNLRNDALRRRVDGVKYDVLKIEEIMYDLAVRQGQGAGCAAAARGIHGRGHRRGRGGCGCHWRCWHEGLSEQCIHRCDQSWSAALRRARAGRYCKTAYR